MLDCCCHCYYVQYKSSSPWVKVCVPIHDFYKFNSCSKIQHRNVVKFVGACTKPPNLYLVTGKTSSCYSFLIDWKVNVMGKTYCEFQCIFFSQNTCLVEVCSTFCINRRQPLLFHLYSKWPLMFPKEWNICIRIISYIGTLKRLIFW